VCVCVCVCVERGSVIKCVYVRVRESVLVYMCVSARRRLFLYQASLCACASVSVYVCVREGGLRTCVMCVCVRGINMCVFLYLCV